MNPALASDIAVNFCAVFSIGVALAAMAVRRRWSPVEIRLAAVLVLVALLYGLRGLFWIEGDEGLNGVTLAPAALLPLAMLCLVEGLLRRHAPFALKIAVSLATLAMLVGLAFGAHAAGSTFDLTLAAFQGLTLLVLAWLVVTRDRSSLGRLENRTIDIFTVMALLLLPALVSDFRALVPDVPVRMSALGICALLFVMLRLGRSSASIGRCLGELAGALVAAVALGLVAATVAEVEDGATRLRLIIVLCAAILGAMAAVVAYILHVQSRRASFIGRLLEAETREQDAFLAAVAEHPAISDLQILGPAELASYSGSALAAAFRNGQVVALDQVSRATATDSMEQVRDLLLSRNKSHALLINEQPLRLALIDLPSMISGSGQILELRLLQRLAQLIGARGQP